MVILTNGTQFIDLKDTEGDKAAGILTLPVVLGMRRAQFVIAGLFTIGYLALVVISKGLVWRSIFGLLGIAQAAALTRRRYDERAQVLLIYPPSR